MGVSDLGRAMKEAREAQGWRQDDAVRRAGTGISKPQWSKLENGHPGNYRTATYAAIDRALEWARGTAAALAAGQAVAEPVSSGSPTDLEHLLEATRVAVENLRAEVDRLSSEVEQLQGAAPPRPSSARPAKHAAG